MAGAIDKYKLDDVYGISREVPLNYVSRPEVDGELVASLSRDKHLVIFGSSKQGKTSLRKWNLNDDEYIVVTCSNKWGLSDLHSAVLKQAGYTIEQSVTRTVSGGNMIAAKGGGSLKAGPFLAINAEFGGEDTKGSETATEEVSLELDPQDVNDIIRALQEVSFAGFIVLEDFHYLPEETQRDFAVALKAFHEASPYIFIVVGVWLDENRLIQHNGDLAGRVIAVDADQWSPNELREVISKGAALLNVSFANEFINELVAGCFESVYVVQEVCHLACENEGIFETQVEPQMVGKGARAADLIRKVVDADSARYNGFITNFAEGFVKTDLEMYRYLLVPVLTASPVDLEKGLLLGNVRSVLAEYHPRGNELNAGNVTQALQSAASLQVGKLKIKPIVLDYDQSNRRLDVVDRGFLIWLQYQNRAELLASIDVDPKPQTTGQLSLEGVGPAAGRMATSKAPSAQTDEA